MAEEGDAPADGPFIESKRVRNHQGEDYYSLTSQRNVFIRGCDHGARVFDVNYSSNLWSGFFPSFFSFPPF